MDPVYVVAALLLVIATGLGIAGAHVLWGPGVALIVAAALCIALALLLLSGSRTRSRR